MAEVGFVAEIQIRGHGFVRIAMLDEILRQTTLEPAKPSARSDLKMFREVPFQVPQRNPANHRQFRRFEMGLLAKFFPILYSQQSRTHTFSSARGLRRGQITSWKSGTNTNQGDRKFCSTSEVP